MLFRGTKSERDALIAALGSREYILSRRIHRMEDEGKDRSAQRQADELVLVQEMRAGLKGARAIDRRAQCQTAAEGGGTMTIIERLSLGAAAAFIAAASMLFGAGFAHAPAQAVQQCSSVLAGL